MPSTGRGHRWGALFSDGSLAWEGLPARGWAHRIPEPDPPGDASRVVDDRGLWTQVDVEVDGVATADVQVVEEEQGVDVVHRLLHPVVPLLLAHALAGGVADLL